MATQICQSKAISWFSHIMVQDQVCFGHLDYMDTNTFSYGIIFHPHEEENRIYMYDRIKTIYVTDLELKF